MKKKKILNFMFNVSQLCVCVAVVHTRTQCKSKGNFLSFHLYISMFDVK